jgi:ribosomal protein L29
MLDEAADRTPLGSLSLTGDQVEIRLPPWLTDSSVEVVDRAFTPYYDRRAICALFHVGIETVSEYQREELHAVAIDLNGHEERPRLAETCLNLVAGEQQKLDEGQAIDEQALTDALDAAQTALESELAPTVRDTRERATHAAEVELDEYRQYVLQRRDEIADEIDSLTSRIEDVTERVDTATEQGERVEALRKRKELQAELDDLRAELDDLTTQIETGFPEKRREIRERHAITVRLRPVTATTVSHERGDLDLTLRTGEFTVSRSYGYAVGAGVVEERTCERCGQQLTAQNPIDLDGKKTVGTACCDG